MVTAHPGSLIEERALHSLKVARLALATGITAGVVFVLCWFGIFIPFSSGLAVVEGAYWSLLFGLIVGALFALIYNATPPLRRKPGEDR